MKNITVTVDPETAAWVRVYAAEKGMSVSRLVGELLQERMRDGREYDRAMRRYLSKPPFDLKGPAEPLPTKDEIHDRSRLR
jgi:hypothetical protein